MSGPDAPKGLAVIASRLGPVGVTILMLVLVGVIALPSRLPRPAADTLQVAAAPEAGPSLTLPESIRVSPGEAFTLSLGYAANGHAISSMAFSLDYDERWLRFDDRDADGDGRYDRLRFQIARGVSASLRFDPEDRDGELDVLIFDSIPPLAPVPEGLLLQLGLVAGEPALPTAASLRFSVDPAPSFGNTAGRSIAGEWSSGWVQIGEDQQVSIQLPLLLFGP